MKTHWAGVLHWPCTTTNDIAETSFEFESNIAAIMTYNKTTLLDRTIDHVLHSALVTSGGAWQQV